MNISEAHAVNTILHHFTGTLPPSGEAPSHDDVWNAAEFLAERASQALYAGLRPIDVAKARAKAEQQWERYLADDGDFPTEVEVSA